MDRLFNLEEGYNPVPSEEVYLIEEFKALLTLKYNKKANDTDGRKRIRGISELRFIYFFCDYRSAFAKYPEPERREEALRAAGLSEKHKNSYQLDEAIKRYQKLQDSRIIRMLRAARNAVDKVTGYFETVELVDEAEDGTKTINQNTSPKDVLTTLASLPKVVKSLEDLEDQVKKHEQGEVQLRGDQEKGRL